MTHKFLPILACLVAGGIATAQTNTESNMDMRPEYKHQVEFRIAPHCFTTGAFLGVHPVEVTNETATKYGMADPHGALLQKVEENTAASRAGLLAEDIIVEWNGTRVESAVQLRRMINETPIGRKVRITYLRNGVRSTVETPLDERKMPEFRTFPEMPPIPKEFLPENFEEMMKDAPKLGSFHMVIGDGRMGAKLQNITPQLATYYGVEEGSGALIGSVKEGSAAATAGLQDGDIIVAVDGEKVTSPRDVTKAIAKKEGEVEVRVIRDKQEQSFRVKLEGPAMNYFELPGMEGLEKLRNGEFKMFQGFQQGFPMEMDGDVEIFIAPPQGGEAPESESEATPELGEPDLGNYLVPRNLRQTEHSIRFLGKPNDVEVKKVRTEGKDI